MGERLVTEYEYTRGRRGADRAVLLAHGAGADMHAPAVAAFSDALGAAGIPTLRFHYPYRTAGRRAPDRPAVLLAATREAVAELARRARVPVERLVIGGRSMGGRYCSLVAADEERPVAARGLLLLAYPLYAPGKAERPRSEHFGRLDLPVMFVSGTRDPMADRARLRRAARAVPGPVTFCWVADGDHGFRPRARSGHTFEEVLAGAAASVVAWVEGLPERPGAGSGSRPPRVGE